MSLIRRPHSWLPTEHFAECSKNRRESCKEWGAETLMEWDLGRDVIAPSSIWVWVLHAPEKSLNFYAEINVVLYILEGWNQWQYQLFQGRAMAAVCLAPACGRTCFHLCWWSVEQSLTVYTTEPICDVIGSSSCRYSTSLTTFDHSSFTVFSSLFAFSPTQQMCLDKFNFLRFVGFVLHFFCDNLVVESVFPAHPQYSPVSLSIAQLAELFV